MSVQSLANTIAKAINEAKNYNDTAVKQGTISGTSVEINGKYYNYSVAVDIEIENGDGVYVLLNDTKTRAVVVGK